MATRRTDFVTAALQQASSALVEAAKLLASEFAMPAGSGLSHELIEDQLRYEVMGALESEEDLDVDERDVDLSSQLEPGSPLMEEAESFSRAAFAVLHEALAKVMSSDEETIKEAVLDCWEGGGRRVPNSAWLMYQSALESGIGPKDYWNEAAKSYGFDLKQLDQEIKNLLRQQAHALESAFYNAANYVVDDYIASLTGGEGAAPALRGPEHDKIVYRYVGNNSSIAGASARGMYVAELSLGGLKDESRELGHCIGNRKHGHPQLLEAGVTRVFSIRTEAGKSKFTIEQFIEDGKHPVQGQVARGTVTEVKGQSNRFPGFVPNSKELTKPDEVKLVTEFLIEYLGMTPAQIEGSNDIRGGVLAMKALGLDPFSPPPAKAARPKRDPRALEAAVRVLKADYALIQYGLALPFVGVTLKPEVASVLSAASPKKKTKDKVAILKWGARWLYADDPESFVGGCGDIADALERFCKRLKIEGVKAVGGIAHTKEPIMHAWIEVDGRIYDARKDVERRRYTKHRKEQEDVSFFCFPGDIWGDDKVLKMADDFLAGKPAPVVTLLSDEEIMDY